MGSFGSEVRRAFAGLVVAGGLALGGGAAADDGGADLGNLGNAVGVGLNTGFGFRFNADAKPDKLGRMSEEERDRKIFSAMMFPHIPDVLSPDHPRRLLNKWDGLKVIRIGAVEYSAGDNYRAVAPGGEHYDDLENVTNQLRRVASGIDFRIVPEGDSDIIFVFSDENIYDLMKSKSFFRVINGITRAKTEAHARANHGAVLYAEERKWHCVGFHGYNAAGGILDSIVFYQNDPLVFHPQLDAKTKRKIKRDNLWKHCAMAGIMFALGVIGQPPREVASVLNATGGRLTNADKMVLRALYSGRVESGMTKDETLARLFSPVRE